ncbi:MAG: hypothetical protein UZ12_BCD005002695 [Bacteroidetes bacterium OLB12]|nr:MAG: hypothetical protein UZ12_BCD005002695 [Bacteroidetes bacterium OLB12]HNR73812.1 hypothetical protein [Cyclobacteriaceae bacterium]
MKDSLKDFIDNNRQAFDNRVPSEKVWKGIESNLPQTTWWHNIAVWRAAAIILFCVSGFLLFTNKPAGQDKRQTAQLQGEFRNLEKFYSDQIAEKVEWISDTRDTFADDQFAQDFEKLDAMYQVLLEQMKTNPTEQVKDALVLNMLVRIDLLNQQIQKLEESKRAARAGKDTAI